ncbi:MAG: hypothetical protein ACUVTP_12210 [Candidatus Fervidibacter sp.]
MKTVVKVTALKRLSSLSPKLKVKSRGGDYGEVKSSQGRLRR